MNLLIKLLITTVLIVVIAHFFPGISVDNFSTALVVAVVLGLLNVFIKPILVLFTIPATIITLGLFLLVINAVIILLGDYFVSGFHVNGFWTAFLFSIVLSVFQSILNKILVDEK
ncbi:MAG: phage holin family protein [Flavobacteriaceae bacterium]|nr:phage holin family protein [Flavobacteriaceae bacterium]